MLYTYTEAAQRAVPTGTWELLVISSRSLHFFFSYTYTLWPYSYLSKANANTEISRASQLRHISERNAHFQLFLKLSPLKLKARIAPPAWYYAAEWYTEKKDIELFRFVKKNFASSLKRYAASVAYEFDNSRLDCLNGTQKRRTLRYFAS